MIRSLIAGAATWLGIIIFMFFVAQLITYAGGAPLSRPSPVQRKPTPLAPAAVGTMVFAGLALVACSAFAIHEIWSGVTAGVMLGRRGQPMFISIAPYSFAFNFSLYVTLVLAVPFLLVMAARALLRRRKDALADTKSTEAGRGPASASPGR